MSVKIACPKCRTLYKLPETSVGKKVRCQKCEEKFIATPMDKNPEDEAITARPKVAAPAAAPRKSREVEVEPEEERPRRKRPRDDDEVEEERPRKRRREEAEGEDEDRPRKRRRDEEDEDEDRPRKRRRDDEEDADDDDDDEPRGKKKKKAAQANVPLVIGCMVGVVLLMGGTSAAITIWSIKNAVPLEQRFAAAMERDQARFDRQFNKGSRFFDPNAKLEVKGPGREVKLPTEGIYKHSNHLAKTDPQLGNKHYKLYLVPMEKGKLYQVDMTSDDIDPFLALFGPDDKLLAQHDDVAGEELNARIVFAPPETGQYKVIATACDFVANEGETASFAIGIQPAAPGSVPTPVQPNPGTPQANAGAGRFNPRAGRPGRGGGNLGRLNVSAKATAITLGPNGAFTQNGALNATDPTLGEGRRYKLYSLAMEQGKTYRISLASTNFDAYLYVVSSGGEVLAEDDDGGNGTDSSLDFQCPTAGVYRIVATSLDGDEGSFIFGVRRQ